MRLVPAFCCVAVLACASAQQNPVPGAHDTDNGNGNDNGSSVTVGPERGTLFIAGGGALDRALIAQFIELAGGADARIVVVPTASADDTFPENWPGLRMFRDAGARSVTILHTRSRIRADSDHFVEPLRTATGVWFSGGRQWRLADSYNDTRTLREIMALLERGGVVGGTSAGASIQASYMVRGAIETNEIMMAPGRETGFGLLRNTAIDQHLTARGRQNDMLEVVRLHPALLGIGLDEGTALIVTRDRGTITGRGRVAFYNTADADGMAYYFLAPGDTFDLAQRRTLSGTRIPPHVFEQDAA